MPFSRRRFLATIGVAARLGSLERLLDASGAADLVPIPGGQFVKRVPLGRFDGRPAPPLGSLLGAGLDARQFNDISGLASDSLITASDQFFVRTAASAATTPGGPWTLAMGGRVRRASELRVDALASQVRPQGAHLMECSGNADPANFGLIGTARWDGVPMLAVLERVQAQAGPWRVLVSGLDDLSTPSRSSIPGASWIFSRDDLEQTGAFLATRMNGAALAPHHGFPVRLVVPGWYGCSCIKWVTRIDLVADDVESTEQMREFAGRTHQDGVPERARDFEAPAIDLAAMPIRVEQWRRADGGGLVYRVIGVRWGGGAAARAARAGLTIRFKYTDAFVPVDRCEPSPATGTSWTLWSHLWRPEAPGRYQIVLGTNDPTIRTRRLDLRFYTRDVQIDDV